MNDPIMIRPRAEADLLDLASYLARDSFETAARFHSVTRQTFQWLAETPGVGRRRFDISNARLVELRSWRIPGFDNYLICYRPLGHGIEIIRGLHGAHRLISILEDE